MADNVNISSLTVTVKGYGIDETKQQLSNFNRVAANTEDRVNRLTDKIGKLSSQFNLGKEAARLYQESVERAKTSVGGHDVATTALTNAMKGLTSALSTLNANVELMSVNTKKATTSTAAFSSTMMEAHAVVRGFSGSLGALWMTYGNIIPMLVGIIAGISFKSAVSSGMEFEQSLEGIRVRSQETIGAVAELKDEALRLGQGAQSPLQIAKAMETMSMAGLSAKEVLIGIKDALNLAVAGGTSIENAANTLVTVATAMNVSVASYSYITDVIAKAAAVSKTSVEGISAGFRNAAAVNAMYGVSLVELGTQMAVLSKLGIDYGSLGTNIKNFYKAITSDAPKVQRALNDIGVSVRDSQGNVKPMLQLVGELDAGLKKYSRASQDAYMTDLSNAQGMRLLVQLRRSYNTEVKNGAEVTNELAQALNEVKNSGGFAAIANAQMSLTSKNQFESIKNTLQGSLISAFDEISPELNIISAKLKETFASEEFKTAIRGIVSAIANLGSALAANLDKILIFADAVIALKASMVAFNALQGVSAGITAFATATGAATVAAQGATVAVTSTGTALLWMAKALPIVGAVLTAVTVAWGLYEIAQGRAKDKTQEAAEVLSKNYLGKLKEELEHLNKVNELLKKGIDLKEADKRATQELAMASLEASNKKARDEAWFAFEAVRAKYIAQGASTQQINESGEIKYAYDIYIAAEERLKSVRSESATLVKAINDAGAENARLTEANISKQKDLRAATDGTLEREKNKLSILHKSSSEAQKQYEIALKTQALQIRSDAKLGKIGSFQEISMLGSVDFDRAANRVATAKSMAEAARKQGDAKLTERYNDEMLTAEAEFKAVSERLWTERANKLQQLEKELTQDKIAELERQGKYEEAANMRYSELYAPRINGLKADIQWITSQMDGMSTQMKSATDAKQIEELTKGWQYWNNVLTVSNKALENLTAKGKAFTDAASFKDAKNRFDNTLAAARNEAEIVNQRVNTGGVAGFISPDREVLKFRNETLTSLRDELETLKLKPFDEKSQKETEERIKQLTKFLEENTNEFTTAYYKYIKSASGSMETVFTTTFKGLEDSLTKFFTTGKFGWKDFADSVIAEIARMQAKMLVAKMFGGTGGQASGGGEGMQLLGMAASMFGGSGGSAFGTMLSDFGENAWGQMSGGSYSDWNWVDAADYTPSYGMANGGEAAPYTVREVNEKGIEMATVAGKDYLLTGGQGAKVTPNGSLGGDTHITYSPTIQIDSRSDEANIRKMVRQQVEAGKSELMDKLQRSRKI